MLVTKLVCHEAVPRKAMHGDHYLRNEYVTIAVNRNLSNCKFIVFHSFQGLMNSINWPASSVWVFIAQLVEHCSANAEATGLNPVEVLKNCFTGYFAI